MAVKIWIEKSNCIVNDVELLVIGVFLCELGVQGGGGVIDDLYTGRMWDFWVTS